jgi:hypothetical protein
MLLSLRRQQNVRTVEECEDQTLELYDLFLFVSNGVSSPHIIFSQTVILLIEAA